MGKIVEENDIEEVVLALRQRGKKIVTTNGCFDILHIGHVKYLQKAKRLGDILIVALNSDVSTRKLKGAGRPINNQRDRAEMLIALRCVDIVVIFNEISPKDLLNRIKPDIHTKGADYTKQTLPEADIIELNGGKVEFIDFVEGKSTTNIIKKIKE